MKFLFILFMSSLINNPYDNLAVSDLKIQVNNVPSSKGNLMIAVYNKEEGFREKENTFRNMIVPAKKGTMEITISQILPDIYAVAVYHDANGNGKLDKNFFGVPTEYYGFSNDARGSFGPPSYKDCSFSMSANKTISINLK